MSEPQLRAKVRRGLLKVEQLHALARAVYYGQRGRISAREVYDQMNACSCLTLILACIVYWQAREISRLAAAPDFPFDPDLLRHVSPIDSIMNRERSMRPTSRSADASSFWRGYAASLRKSWLGRMVPAAMVAATRKFRSIRSTFTLPPTRGRRCFGTPARSNT